MVIHYNAFKHHTPFIIGFEGESAKQWHAVTSVWLVVSVAIIDAVELVQFGEILSDDVTKW